ncbi:MAG TPA: response regulator transcription factor [Epsilonproteobacteria bacterium]|nr:response regulator transcription factor [Campylobacterota bacterium]
MSKEKIEIVIVEDQSDILELMEYHLQKEGYSTIGFFSTERVEQFLEEENPSLMIIDRNLPGTEGGEFVASLRAKGYTLPVIFVTAKDSSSELEEGFEMGGDDYLTKPFSPKELLLRVRALLRRSGVIDAKKVRYKNITIDKSLKKVWVNYKSLELSPLEFSLLVLFVENPDKIFERETLHEMFWQDKNQEINTNAMNVTISRLKKKIDPTKEYGYIASVWGLGYKFH